MSSHVRLHALIAGIAFCSASPTMAVNKCTDAAGQVVFSDKACPRDPGLARLDPVPTGKAPIGNGVLTPEERKAIVDRMNADVSAAIVRQARQEAESERIRAREEAARPKPVSQSQELDFDRCRAVVARTLLSVAGSARTITVMDNDAVTAHRVCLRDGSLLLTCSAPDRRFVQTTSPPDGRGC